MTVQSCVVQCITQFSANEKRETCEILWERREESSLEAGEVCDVEGGGWWGGVEMHPETGKAFAGWCSDCWRVLQPGQDDAGRSTSSAGKRGVTGPEVLHTLDSLPPPGVSQPSDDDDQHHLCMMCMDLNSRLDPFVEVSIGVLFITV